MNAEIENIIVNNDYAALTAEQKSALSDWVASEEEFATMKQIMVSAPLLNTDVAPSPKLKSSLMDTFAATYPAGTAMASSGGAVNQKGNNKKILFMWFRAGAAVAAILLAVFLIYPLFNSPEKSNLVAENEAVKKGKNQTSKQDNIAAPAMDSEESEVASNESEETNSIPAVVPRPELSEQVVPTTGPYDGKAFEANGGAVDLADMVIDYAPSPVIANYTNAGSEPTSTSTFGGVGSTATSSGLVRDEFKISEHSDRLAAADLPEQSRQVIHERPELLDLLHTSF